MGIFAESFQLGLLVIMGVAIRVEVTAQKVKSTFSFHPHEPINRPLMRNEGNCFRTTPPYSLYLCSRPHAVETFILPPSLAPPQLSFTLS